MKDFYRLRDECPEEYLQIVSSLMDDYLGNILIFDQDERIVFMSNSTCRDLGCSKEEMIGQHKSILTKLGYTERSASELSRQSRRTAQISVKALKTHETMFASSLPVLDKNGDVIFVINRSETEKDLLKKMDAIYEERLLLERPYKTDHQYVTSSRQTIIARSPATQQVFQLADEISQRDSTVMLTGEPGVGKEVLAQYIFRRSSRSSKPFISVNCSAIPSELMESELFGYEKGSFTGASRNGKAGLFELANTGTLFLDEIGELPLTLQPKLLRVLDSGEYLRVGGQTLQHTDVRIIAATNRNLREMVNQGLFREDLFYRLNVIPIKIPPLRERKEDIQELADAFLNAYNRKYNTHKKLAIQTQTYLMQYRWPGNIRELKNIIERLATISKSDIIFLNNQIDDDLPSVSIQSAPEKSEDGFLFSELPLSEAVHSFEVSYIRRTVSQCGGNVSKAAAKLGIHRSAIYRKLGRSGT